MLGKLSHGTNLNDNSDCQRFGQLLWPSSGQIVKKLVQVLSICRHAQRIIKCQERHRLPRARAWLRSAALCCGSAELFFRVVNQQPGTSRPTSQLRSSSVAVWMWRASFSWSSLGLLARSITLVSSYLMGWWCLQACSATADVSSIPLQQVSHVLHPCLKPPGCLANVSLPSAAVGSGIQPWTVSLLEVCP